MDLRTVLPIPIPPIPTLAVVTIARNEDRFIAGCIDSLLRATSSFGFVDIVVVDSASSDRTLEIARRFPVRIARLRASPFLCASMARAVGEQLTVSEFILFVDGDTEISGEWVVRGIELLRDNPLVGGVAGKLREIYYQGDRIVGENADFFEHATEHVETVHQLGGNAMYRRTALEAVGSFNPYILSYEEAELAERLRRAGFSTVRMPLHVGTHRTGARGTIAELRRRYQERLMIGYGQVLRRSIRDRLLVRHAWRMRRHLEFLALAGVSAGVVALSLWRQDGRPVIGLLTFQAALFAAFAMKARGFRKPLRLLRDWSVESVALVVGFCRRPKNPREFAVQDALMVIEDLPPETSAGIGQGVVNCSS